MYLACIGKWRSYLLLINTNNSILIHPAFRCSNEKMKDKIWEGRVVISEGKNIILGNNILGQIWMNIRNKYT